MSVGPEMPGPQEGRRPSQDDASADERLTAIESRIALIAERLDRIAGRVEEAGRRDALLHEQLTAALERLGEQLEASTRAVRDQVGNGAGALRDELQRGLAGIRAIVEAGAQRSLETAEKAVQQGADAERRIDERLQERTSALARALGQRLQELRDSVSASSDTAASARSALLERIEELVGAIHPTQEEAPDLDDVLAALRSSVEGEDGPGGPSGEPYGVG